MDDKTRELIKRLTQTISLMFVIILVLISIILVMGYWDNGSKTAKAEKESPLFCGTDVFYRDKTENKANRFGLTGDFKKGQKLFKQNCAVCHALTDQNLTGPGLRGIFDRVPAPQANWIKNYISNNEKIKKKHNPYALMLSAKYKNTVMTIFEGTLSDGEINDIVYYLLGQ